MNNFLLELDLDSSLAYAILQTLVNESRRDYCSVAKVNHYVENTVLLYSLDDFRSIFRLSRHGFEHLTRKLAITPAFSNNESCGRHQKDIVVQCLLSLRYFGTQESLQSIGELFGVTKSSAFNIVKRFCSGIVPHLSSELIKCPTFDQQVEIGKQFSMKSRFPPVVIGAIDCRENPILKPIDNHESFYNRKHFHSIKIQAICDWEGKYVDVFIGWPGRSHDARTFINSPIFQTIQNENVLKEGYVILADSAYPLKEWLLTPYKVHAGGLSLEKRLYNKEHSKARQVIECAFGRTVERFRRLKFVYSRDISFCIQVCLTACVLHNFCTIHNELPFVYTHDDVNDDAPIFNIFGNDVPGVQKRDAIALSLLDS
jgi:hypothetical protein